MADISKFNGYMASDGTPHKTKKAVIAYMLDLKTKAALAVIASGFGTAPQPNPYFDGTACVNVLTEVNLATWLAANRDAIMAAFTQDVRTRRPGSGRKKAVATSPATTETVPA